MIIPVHLIGGCRKWSMRVIWRFGLIDVDLITLSHVLDEFLVGWPLLNRIKNPYASDPKTKFKHITIIILMMALLCIRKMRFQAMERVAMRTGKLKDLSQLEMLNVVSSQFCNTNNNSQLVNTCQKTQKVPNLLGQEECLWSIDGVIQKRFYLNAFFIFHIRHNRC